MILFWRKHLLYFFLCFGIVLLYRCSDKREVSFKSNEEKQELVNQLNKIYEDDQALRRSAMAAISEYGIKSEEVLELGKRIHQLDSSNLIAVKAILDKYGWLGSDIVGAKGNSALFLVIQHSDDTTQQFYLPIMRKAVKDNAASSQDLAKLEDRVAIHQGKKQIYGTQMGFDEETESYFLLPLLDPVNVNKRRESMGLEPLPDSLKQMQIHQPHQRNDLK